VEASSRPQYCSVKPKNPKIRRLGSSTQPNIFGSLLGFRYSSTQPTKILNRVVLQSPQRIETNANDRAAMSRKGGDFFTLCNIPKFDGIPPQQRSQCRFFNVEKLVDWATKVINLSHDTLFELIPNKVLNNRIHLNHYF
jgi:hypothetical protein